MVSSRSSGNRKELSVFLGFTASKIKVQSVEDLAFGQEQRSHKQDQNKGTEAGEGQVAVFLFIMTQTGKGQRHQVQGGEQSKAADYRLPPDPQADAADKLDHGKHKKADVPNSKEGCHS